MGLILSRIYDKPSTRDTLEKIEQEIQNIEERRWDKIKREQFVVQILSFLPLTILIVNICIFIYPSDSSWRDKLLLSVPIAILNLVLWVGRKMVQWYSRWSLENEEGKLRKLQKQKKRILEMVCETESYRVATELLEKYDPKQLRRREKNTEFPPPNPNVTLTKTSMSAASTPVRSPHQQKQSIQSQYHQQAKPQATNFLASHNQSMNLFAPHQQMNVPAPPPPTPVSKLPTNAHLNTSSSNLHNASMNSVIVTSTVQGRPVRPILSKDRSIFEKMVDWVVADGPDNRFALICRYCYGHNGMSLAEEFETINFRCCYCYNLNTASTKRHQLHDQLQTEREKEVDGKLATKTDDLKAIVSEKSDSTAKSINSEMVKENSSHEANEKLENGVEHEETKLHEEVKEEEESSPKDSGTTNDEESSTQES